MYSMDCVLAKRAANVTVKPIEMSQGIQIQALLLLSSDIGNKDDPFCWRTMEGGSQGNNQGMLRVMYTRTWNLSFTKLTIKNTPAQII